MKKRKLGVMLKRLHNSFEAEVNQVLKEHDITKVQCDVLLFLSRHRNEKINQRDIENYFGISNPTVSGILTRLEAKGWIEKVTCQKDARNKYILETTKAKEMDTVLRTSFENKEKQLKEGLSKEEEELLFVLLEKLLSNTHK